MAGAVSFSNPTTLRSGGVGGTVLISNALGYSAGAPNLSYTFAAPGGISIGSTVTTLNGAVTFSNDVTLTGNSGVDTTNATSGQAGAAITFSGRINDSAPNTRDLSLTRGSGGSIALTTLVGNLNQPRTLTVRADGGFSATQAVKAQTIDLYSYSANYGTAVPIDIGANGPEPSSS